jgi:hypothetical protein
VRRRHFKSARTADHEYRGKQKFATKNAGDQGCGHHHSGQRIDTLGCADD